MSDNTCTIILPTYNEEENIVNIVTTLRELYSDFNILIMDDNSKDNSKNLVESLEDSKVTFFVRDPDDRGLSASICQGIVESKTKFFVNMDSDFQHPPSAVKQIYESLQSGSDLCIGVRNDRVALGFTRWFGSWAFHILAMSTLFVHGKKGSKDIMSGLFGGRSELFRTVVQENEEKFEMKGFKALFDLLKYSPPNIKISEISFEFGERQGGDSKISPKVVSLTLRQCGIVGKFISKIYSAVKK